LVGGYDIYSVCDTSASQYSCRGPLPLHHDGAGLNDIFIWYRTWLVTSGSVVFVLPAIVSIAEGQSRPMSTFDPQNSGCVSWPCAEVWRTEVGDWKRVKVIIVELTLGAWCCLDWDLLDEDGFSLLDRFQSFC